MNASEIPRKEYGYLLHFLLFYFFFQAEDGIRDRLVTGVQTCALPILQGFAQNRCEKIKMENENQPLVSIGVPVFNGEKGLARALDSLLAQIGRASCRERV